VPSPAKLRALWVQQLADGLTNGIAMTRLEYLDATETITSAVDVTNIPAAYLLTAADLFDTEAPAGALGGAATSWLRSGTFADIAEDVPGEPGLMRLRWLGVLHYYAPGIFHTGTRDLPGQPYRIVLELSRERSEQANMPFSSLPTTYPIGTAGATLAAFGAAMSRGWGAYDDVSGIVLGRRLGAFASRLALATVSGASAEEASVFRQQLCRQLQAHSSKLPALFEVFSPLTSFSDIEAGLVRIAASCFAPPLPPPGCLDDIMRLERLVEGSLVPLQQAAKTTSSEKVAWVCVNVNAAASVPTPASAHSGVASSANLSSTALERLREQMGSAGFMATVNSLQAELSAAPVSSLNVSAVLTSSSVLAIHRLGLGFGLVAGRILFRADLEKAEAFSAQWDFNLSMRLVADDQGVINTRAQSFRLSRCEGLEGVGEAIRTRRHLVRARLLVNVKWLLRSARLPASRASVERSTTRTALTVGTLATAQ